MQSLFSAMREEPTTGLIGGFLHPTGVTLLYGKGGVGKGLVAAHLTKVLAEHRVRVVILDFENNPNEWIFRVGHPSGTDPVYMGLDGDLLESKQEITNTIAEHGGDYLIIDSATMAQPEKKGYSERGNVRLFFRQLHSWGIPALVLAHAPKAAADDVATALGTVQWSAQSRLVWHATSPDNMPSTSEHHRVLLECTKANDRPLSPDRVLTWAVGARSSSMRERVSTIIAPVR